MATAAASCTSLRDRSFFSIYVKSTACLDFNDADANLASVASKHRAGDDVGESNERSGKD